MNKLQYRGLHNWVERQLGKPMNCTNCHDTGSNRYHWANISQEYKKNLNDWVRLCAKCHNAYDSFRMEGRYSVVARNRPDECYKGHKFTRENTYNSPAGKRICRICKNDVNREYLKVWRRRKKEVEIHL